MKRRNALGIFNRQKERTVANTSQPGPREGLERKKSKEVGGPREIGPCRTWGGILFDSKGNRKPLEDLEQGNEMVGFMFYKRSLWLLFGEWHMVGGGGGGGAVSLS